MRSYTPIALQIIVGLGIGAALPVSAFAQAETGVQARLTPAYRECHTRSGGGFPEAVCLGEESLRQDARLNAQWRRTLSGMSALEGRSLRRHQRGWIARRDAHCKAEVVADDVLGATAKLVYNDCYLDLTVRRIMFLERLR